VAGGEAKVDGFARVAAVYGVVLLAGPQLPALINPEARYIGGIRQPIIVKGNRGRICRVPPAYHAVAAVDDEEGTAGLADVRGAEGRSGKFLVEGAASLGDFAQGLIDAVISVEDVVFKLDVFNLIGRTPEDLILGFSAIVSCIVKPPPSRWVVCNIASVAGGRRSPPAVMKGVGEGPVFGFVHHQACEQLLYIRRAEDRFGLLSGTSQCRK